MSDMVSNREKTIDEMKIQTMYKVIIELLPMLFVSSLELTFSDKVRYSHIFIRLFIVHTDGG